MSNVHSIGLRTPDEARQWLRANGLSMSRFAREHGLCYSTVRDVLYGQTKGIIGDSHRAAVLLGIKPPPSQPFPLPVPASPHEVIA